MTHSILPPSSAARRVACPGSRALEAKYPQDDSPHSREGDAAHWVLSEYLKNNFRPKLNELTPNGELITQEMLDGAELFLNDIVRPTYSEKQGRFKCSPLHIEEPITIKNIHPECWGTPDCWYFDSATQCLHLWDYKFGHKPVEVFENWQLIEYAAGILSPVNFLQSSSDVKVIFTIIQPRSFHKDGVVRRWKTTAAELIPYFNILEETERTAMSDKALCNPSPECTYCSARHACTALQTAALSAVDLSKMNSAVDLTPNQLGNELRLLQRAKLLLEARITGLEAQALNEIKSGKRVSHFTTEETNGRDQWLLSVEKIIELGELYGKNLAKPIEAITPKQAIKAGVPFDFIKSYVLTPKGALKLVPENNSKTRQIFGENKK